MTACNEFVGWFGLMISPIDASKPTHNLQFSAAGPSSVNAGNFELHIPKWGAYLC